MRFFTHRNKAGRARVCRTFSEQPTALLTGELFPDGAVVTDDVKPDILLNVKADYRSGFHFEQGSGTPGRWWRECTEAEARELLTPKAK